MLVGVALSEYCDKFVVGELQIIFGGIVEDFFIDTLRFLVGEAVACVSTNGAVAKTIKI